MRGEGRGRAAAPCGAVRHDRLAARFAFGFAGRVLSVVPAKARRQGSQGFEFVGGPGRRRQLALPQRTAGADDWSCRTAEPCAVLPAVRGPRTRRQRRGHGATGHCAALGASGTTASEAPCTIGLGLGFGLGLVERRYETRRFGNSATEDRMRNLPGQKGVRDDCWPRLYSNGSSAGSFSRTGTPFRRGVR